MPKYYHFIAWQNGETIAEQGIYARCYREAREIGVEFAKECGAKKLSIVARGIRFEELVAFG